MNLFFELRKELKKAADLKRAKLWQRFFKTGKGEYGEGDVFLGITVPQSRKIAKKYKDLDFPSIENLLHSKIHEERLIALLVLIYKFNTRGYHTNILENMRMRRKVYDFYLKNTRYINNWDLVDLSAPNIVGEHLLFLARQPRVSDDAQPVNLKPSLNSASLSKIRHQSKTQPNFSSSESGLPRSMDILLKLAKSKNLWERRIAVLATFQFIKNNYFEESLGIAEILLNDKHDLIHKAVGWMLREVGKRDLETEIEFLNKHYLEMPRTMLRYSIERFPKNKKSFYLSKK